MAAEAHARSIYRAILRELPPRTPTTAASPIRTSIRQHFKPAATASAEENLARRQEAEQFAQYLKAQRVYGELLDRYNPGMNMDEEERVRLSARRVGMEMPKWKIGEQS
jgi:ATP synthase assembly factor FMC1, mitochondrial